jgi:hypothetical protein
MSGFKGFWRSTVNGIPCFDFDDYGGAVYIEKEWDMPPVRFSRKCPYMELVREMDMMMSDMVEHMFDGITQDIEAGKSVVIEEEV